MQVTLHESNLERIIQLLEGTGISCDKLIASYLKRKLEIQRKETSQLDLDEVPF